MVPTWRFFKNFLEFCSFVVHQVMPEVWSKAFYCVICHIHFHQVQNMEYLSGKEEYKIFQFNLVY